MAGNATGERIPGKKYRAIVEVAAVGDPINRIARKVGVTWRTVKADVSAESTAIAERKQAMLEHSLAISELAAARILDNLQDASPMEANAIYGTATDKVRALSNDPDVIIKHEHEHADKYEHKFVAFKRQHCDTIYAQHPTATETQTTATHTTLPTHHTCPPTPQTRP